MLLSYAYAEIIVAHVNETRLKTRFDVNPYTSGDSRPRLQCHRSTHASIIDKDIDDLGSRIPSQRNT